VSLGCFVSLRTSSFRTNWYHWVTSNPDFKVTPLFDAEYVLEMARDRDIVTMQF